MEPTLLGPQRLARCDQCRRSMRFSAEIDFDDHPTPCPRCGRDVILEGIQAGQSVRIEPIDWTRASLRRGELVAIHDRELDRLEVKRIVGLPWESIEILDGDLWMDGQRFQKSISQFASLAIEVDRWSEIEGMQAAQRSKVPMEQCYRSLSLWPRTGEHLEPTPSPVLDEYRCNARESRELVPVRDMGLKLTLADDPRASAKIEVRIWFEGRVLSLPVELSATGFRIIAPRQSAKASSSEPECPSIPASDLPNDGMHGEAFEYGPHRKTLIVAIVDSRMLVGTERSGCVLDVHEHALDARLSKSECSATKPISLTILDGKISILQAFIIRDIHYRGSDGENEVLLPAVAGYRVLGDNVSNSSDSRQRWPEGIPSESIVGRVYAPLDSSDHRPNK